MERVTGIEPALEAWKASVLPLNHTRDWSGRQDSNLRHPAPKAGALPGCATSRHPNSLISIADFLRVFGQFRAKFTKGIASMGNRVLLFGKRLTERAFEFKYLGQKQRVVSESVIPLRLIGYTALDRSTGIVLPTLLIKVDQVAYESSAALRILHI